MVCASGANSAIYETTIALLIGNEYVVWDFPRAFEVDNFMRYINLLTYLLTYLSLNDLNPVKHMGDNAAVLFFLSPLIGNDASVSNVPSISTTHCRPNHPHAMHRCGQVS